MFKILSNYSCCKKYIKCNIWRVAVRPSYIQDARFLKVNGQAISKSVVNRILIRRSDVAERYNIALPTFPLELTSGFATDYVFFFNILIESTICLQQKQSVAVFGCVLGKQEIRIITVLPAVQSKDFVQLYLDVCQENRRLE